MINKIITLAFVFTLLASCKKDWLDAKPDAELVVPSTLKDLQALLDNTNNTHNITPRLGEMGSDDYYITSTYYQSRSIAEQRIYTWALGDVYEGAPSVPDWELPYKSIYYTNVVLDALNKISITTTNEKDWKNIKGFALFLRAYNYYNLAQIFSLPYNKRITNSGLGLVLRLTPNINEASVRSTIEETYSQIIKDLIEAKNLLTSDIQIYKTRPFQPSAYAMLARVYLTMEDYSKAKAYADTCLLKYNTLIDYNDLSSTTNTPIGKYNTEVLFHSYIATNSINILPHTNGSGFVDSTLYSLYNTNDLRKIIFFKSINSRLAFIGSYAGSTSYIFSGLATDEIYLIRAECYAREGNIQFAMNDVNHLLQTRWKKTVSYPTVTASDSKDALEKIFTERRKELCFRGLRWSDLRRLNLYDDYKKDLIRFINNQTFILKSNSNRYSWPIPNSEILYSKIQQNPRQE